MRCMKEVFKEVLQEFYDEGLPETVVPRDVEFYDQPSAATVVKGMRRTGKTFVTYERIKTLMAQGVPISRIVSLRMRKRWTSMSLIT